MLSLPRLFVLHFADVSCIQLLALTYHKVLTNAMVLPLCLSFRREWKREEKKGGRKKERRWRGTEGGRGKRGKRERHMDRQTWNSLWWDQRKYLGLTGWQSYELIFITIGYLGLLLELRWDEFHSNYIWFLFNVGISKKNLRALGRKK